MAKKFLTGADFSNQRAINLADGSSPTDAVTLQQLQASVRGLDWKPSVRAATTAAITLSATQTVDGAALIVGDRVLVKDQGTASQNGIYVVASGAWTRANDADANAEVTSGLAVTVTEGTVNNDKTFILTTNDPITLDTTSLAFSILGGGGNSYTAGNGLALAGSSFSVVPKSGGGLVVDGTGVSIDPSYVGAAKRYAVNVPNGSTSAAITHGLNTLDVVAAVYEVSGGAEVEVDVVLTSVNVVTLTFAVAPTTGQYRVVIVG